MNNQNLFTSKNTIREILHRKLIEATEDVRNNINHSYAAGYLAAVGDLYNEILGDEDLFEFREMISEYKPYAPEDLVEVAPGYTIPRWAATDDVTDPGLWENHDEKTT